MKEKKMRQKKGVKKKVPMRESNPRPLNLHPATELPPQGLIARTILTYMANLNGHELRVASLAALAPPTIQSYEFFFAIVHSNYGIKKFSLLYRWELGGDSPSKEGTRASVSSHTHWCAQCPRCAGKA